MLTDNMVHIQDRFFKGSDQEPANLCSIFQVSSSIAPSVSIFTDHSYVIQSSSTFSHDQYCPDDNSSHVANLYRTENLDKNPVSSPALQTWHTSFQDISRATSTPSLSPSAESVTVDSTPWERNASSQNLTASKSPKTSIIYSPEKSFLDLFHHKHFDNASDPSTTSRLLDQASRPLDQNSKYTRPFSVSYNVPEPLSKCRSVLDLLCSVYDLVVSKYNLLLIIASHSDC
jgi:hypothetical protein